MDLEREKRGKNLYFFEMFRNREIWKERLDRNERFTIKFIMIIHLIYKLTLFKHFRVEFTLSLNYSQN